MHASLFYLWIIKKSFERARETSETASILWKLWYNKPGLSLDYKLPQQYEGKSVFQTIAIKLQKQPKIKTTRKEHIRLISTGVNVVTKTDDKICLKYYQTL